jgi:hypothetical protein
MEQPPKSNVGSNHQKLLFSDYNQIIDQIDKL